MSENVYISSKTTGYKAVKCDVVTINKLDELEETINTEITTACDKINAVKSQFYEVTQNQHLINQNMLEIIKQTSELNQKYISTVKDEMNYNNQENKFTHRLLWIGLGGCGLTSLGTLILQIIQMCIGG